MDYKYCPMCSRELTNQEKFGQLRQVCPDRACGFVHFLDPKVVAVVLVEQGDKILVGRRNIEPGKGKWSFPGGYVDRGERVEDAARREVKEETNLDIRLSNLLGVYSETDSPQILVVYRATIEPTSDPIRPQLEEVSELAFFSLAEMPRLAFNSEGRILTDWQARFNQP